MPPLTYISMAGMSSDQTEAATITPDAKPSKDFCTRSGMSFFIKNTKAEPSIVPSKGISNPIAIVGIKKGGDTVWCLQRCRLVTRTSHPSA